MVTAPLFRPAGALDFLLQALEPGMTNPTRRTAW
jgi:hypothetical protein